jgi:hypothetical protein
MTDDGDCGAIGGMKIGRGNRSTRRKRTPAPLCPPQNPTWQTRSGTPDRSGGKPATNSLSYGAAFCFSPISSPLTTRRVTVEVFDPASTRVCKEPLSGKFLLALTSTTIPESREAHDCLRSLGVAQLCSPETASAAGRIMKLRRLCY